jgi:hypothetical protein
MLARTDISEARRWVVQAVDKKTVRLNCIHYLLQQMPYVEVERPVIELPQREYHQDYVRHPVLTKMIVPEVY